MSTGTRGALSIASSSTMTSWMNTPQVGQGYRGNARWVMVGHLCFRSP